MDNEYEWITLVKASMKATTIDISIIINYEKDIYIWISP